MKELNVKQLPDNFFTAIGKEWMLVTSGDKEHFNTMTASWGCVGWLWNKPRRGNAQGVQYLRFPLRKGHGQDGVDWLEAHRHAIGQRDL